MGFSINMKVELSNGEILDKLSILMIKIVKITDNTKHQNINKEYLYLLELCNQLLSNNEVQKLFFHLKEINSTLWDIEDAIRYKEKQQQFDDEFVKLARSVYKTNDKRANIKRQINIITESIFVEEKSYEEY